MPCSKCLNSCFSCLYSCCCCEFNFAIFPHPNPTYAKDMNMGSPNIKICEFKNRNSYNVPFISMKVNDGKDALLYFHGNAEDIGQSVNFLIPLQQKIHLNIFIMEYPTYGIYTDVS